LFSIIENLQTDFQCLNKIALMMEAVRMSETSMYLKETTRRHIPEGYHLHTRRRENLKSQDGKSLFN
jgi:hypothetical protein